MFSFLSIVSRIEELRSKGYEIITKCYGLAASGAFVIFVTGNKRISQAHSRFMIHQPSAMSIEMNSTESYRRLSKDMDEIWDRLRSIIKKYTKLDDAFLGYMTESERDEYFWPEQAQFYGIVDIIQ